MQLVNVLIAFWNGAPVGMYRESVSQRRGFLNACVYVLCDSKMKQDLSPIEWF